MTFGRSQSGLVAGRGSVSKQSIRGARNPAFLESFYHGRFIDNLAARHVDEDRGLFHGAKFFFAHQMLGRGGKRQREDHIVRIPQDGNDVLGRIEVIDAGIFAGMQAVGNDAHAHQLAFLGDVLARFRPDR